MENLVIRKMEHEDYDRVYQLAWEAAQDPVLSRPDVPNFTHDVGNTLMEKLQTDPRNVVLAELADEIVGLIVIDTTTSTTLFLDSIYVVPAHRRKGVARQMLKHLRDIWGEQYTCVHARAFSEPGVRFWKTLGFDIKYYEMRLKCKQLDEMES